MTRPTSRTVVSFGRTSTSLTAERIWPAATVARTFPPRPSRTVAEYTPEPLLDTVASVVQCVSPRRWICSVTGVECTLVVPPSLTARPKSTVERLATNETRPVKSTSILPGKPLPPVWRKL